MGFIEATPRCPSLIFNKRGSGRTVWQAGCSHFGLLVEFPCSDRVHCEALQPLWKLPIVQIAFETRACRLKVPVLLILAVVAAAVVLYWISDCYRTIMQPTKRGLPSVVCAAPRDLFLYERLAVILHACVEWFSPPNTTRSSTLFFIAFFYLSSLMVTETDPVEEYATPIKKTVECLPVKSVREELLRFSPRKVVLIFPSP